MPDDAARSLRRLEEMLALYGPGSGAGKLAQLHRLERASLPSADGVQRLHEVLCFLRAYPDDARLLSQVERMLSGFAQRRDLRRHAKDLADTGIAGTEIRFEFFAEMARFLATRWPDRLAVDWAALRRPDQLEALLPLLALYSETPGLDEFDLGLREWIDRMRGPDETDATFLVRRLADVVDDRFLHEVVYQDMGLTLRLAPGPDTPSRTLALAPRRRVAWQSGPLRRERPDLRAEIARPPLGVREVSPSEGLRLIDLAREAMITRSRDLDVFAHGDPRDVRVVDCGDELKFVVIGAVPERRLLLEAVYGMLTLKNGVPIGYVLNSALFGSAEVAYNVFETFRGAEAAHVYARLLATLRLLFGVDAYTIYPYQLGGDGNDEALASGAWWFYQKLGFRARAPRVLSLMKRELRRLQAHPSYRTPISTLERLASENVYLYLGRPRDDIIGVLPLAEIGLRITDHLSERFGSRRAEAAGVLPAEAARRLGLRRSPARTPGERLAWERWSPLVLLLPGVERWGAAQKRGLAAVITAKGGRRETDFVRLFDAHAPLRRALRAVAET